MADKKQAEEVAPPPAKEVEMVEYADAQHFEIRTLTPSDWLKVGVQDGKLIHWHKGNDFRVPRSEFDFLSEDQFAQYVLGDPRIRLVTVEEA